MLDPGAGLITCCRPSAGQPICCWWATSDQLPSVGAACAARSDRASDVAAVVRLETIFRRRPARSSSATPPHQSGLCPKPAPPEDFFLFIKEDRTWRERRTGGRQVASASRTSSASDPHRGDVQVLAPMRNGLAGVTRLNGAAAGGAESRPRTRWSASWRASFASRQRVMQTVNNA